MLYVFWKILWNLLARNKGILIINGMTIYLSSNLPFGAQGVFTGLKGAFVKRVYYKDTNIEAIDYTQRVIKHEYAHYLQRKRLGFVVFWATIIWAYICIWKPHDEKPLEHEAEEYEINYEGSSGPPSPQWDLAVPPLNNLREINMERNVKKNTSIFYEKDTAKKIENWKVICIDAKPNNLKREKDTSDD